MSEKEEGVIRAIARIVTERAVLPESTFEELGMDSLAIIETPCRKIMTMNRRFVTGIALVAAPQAIGDDDGSDLRRPRFA